MLYKRNCTHYTTKDKLNCDKFSAITRKPWHYLIATNSVPLRARILNRNRGLKTRLCNSFYHYVKPGHNMLCLSNTKQKIHI